jgi:hypothetical protein
VEQQGVAAADEGVGGPGVPLVRTIQKACTDGSGLSLAIGLEVFLKISDQDKTLLPGSKVATFYPDPVDGVIKDCQGYSA